MFLLQANIFPMKKLLEKISATHEESRRYSREKNILTTKIFCTANMVRIFIHLENSTNKVKHTL